jgi:hypothetical protein
VDDGWGGWPQESTSPDADAYTIPLEADWLVMPPFEPVPVRATLLVTEGGIGVDQEGFLSFEAVSGGSFPPDPGPGTCTGVPPPIPGGWPGAVVKDVEPPESKAGPLDAVTEEAWVSVGCVVSDDHEVVHMQLWRRFRSHVNDPWGPWESNGGQRTCPFAIWLDAGIGYYEYATMATDTSGNKETLPEVGDAAIQRLPAPSPSASGVP